MFRGERRAWNQEGGSSRPWFPVLGRTLRWSRPGGSGLVLGLLELSKGAEAPVRCAASRSLCRTGSALPSRMEVLLVPTLTVPAS